MGARFMAVEHVRTLRTEFGHAREFSEILTAALDALQHFMAGTTRKYFQLLKLLCRTGPIGPIRICLRSQFARSMSGWMSLSSCPVSYHSTSLGSVAACA